MSNLKHGNLPPSLQDPEFADVTLWLGKFLDKICNDIIASWTAWESTVIYSGDTVSGVGLGTWGGVGSGGTFSNTAIFTISDNFGQYQVTPAITEFVSAIAVGWATVFNTWVTTYTYSGVIFTGTSTATSISPGTFSAIGQSALITFGTKPTYINIYNTIISNMPSFNIANSFVGELVIALSKMLENQWTLWASARTISPTATGVSVAGTGSGTGLSSGGVII